MLSTLWFRSPYLHTLNLNSSAKLDVSTFLCVSLLCCSIDVRTVRQIVPQWFRENFRKCKAWKQAWRQILTVINSVRSLSLWIFTWHFLIPSAIPPLFILSIRFCCLLLIIWRNLKLGRMELWIAIVCLSGRLFFLLFCGTKLNVARMSKHWKFQYLRKNQASQLCWNCLFVLSGR